MTWTTVLGSVFYTIADPNKNVEKWPNLKISMYFSKEIYTNIYMKDLWNFLYNLMYEIFC